MHRVAFALFLLGSPAHALSCLPPDAVRLYSDAAASEDHFVIVIGRLHPDREIEIPPASPDSVQETEAVTRVRMSGHLLGSDGFEEAFDRDIDVSVTCLSVWCGAPATDRDIVAALRLVGDRPRLEVGPCGGMAVTLEDADVEGLLRCHRTGECVSG